MADRGQMTWEQKAAALNAVASISIRIRRPGDWYVHQDAEIGGDGILSGRWGHGTTPEEAIEDHWQLFADPGPAHPKYVVINAYQENRKQLRWNGFMWVDVPLNRTAKSDSRD